MNVLSLEEEESIQFAVGRCELSVNNSRTGLYEPTRVYLPHVTFNTETKLNLNPP